MVGEITGLSLEQVSILKKELDGGKALVDVKTIDPKHYNLIFEVILTKARV
jgi:hypothetical protein